MIEKLNLEKLDLETQVETLMLENEENLDEINKLKELNENLNH